jgi:hypothetical protein
MAKQNRDEKVRGNAQESGRPQERQPERGPERTEQEQVKGSGSSDQPHRPMRQPGRLPLPD